MTTSSLHRTLLPSRASESWHAARPTLLRVCAGEPLALTAEDLTLFDLIDRAGEFVSQMFDPTADPDDYKLAEVIVEYLCEHYGLDRAAGGKRVTAVVSDAVRYLLPAAVEHTQQKATGRSGVAALLVRDLKPVARMLAGEVPLPAATVAGDLLGRRGAACLWLSWHDAARVCVNGMAALRVAVAAGEVQPQVDVRSGVEVISPADLRAAGLLLEPDTPHGLELGTSSRILRTLELALARAVSCGARLRGEFKLGAIKPLPRYKGRRTRTEGEYLSLGVVREMCTHLPVLGQVCLWTMRLTGLRIGEVYGMHVEDFGRDELGRAFLWVTKQGGLRSLDRDPDSGRFVQLDERAETKTRAGHRRLHIVEPLAQLIEAMIEVFHVDPRTGAIDPDARLLPGIGKDDVSGQSTLRRWLGVAAAECGVAMHPHTLRAALSTDLKRHRVERRIRFAYLGHEDPEADIQDRHYDLGVTFEEHMPVLSVIGTDLAAFAATGDVTAASDGPGSGHHATGILMVATELCEQWGRGTRMAARAEHIESRLRALGWRKLKVGPNGEPVLNCREAATRLGVSERAARTLMRNGDIAAHTRPWGTRSVWQAYERDVVSYANRRQAPTVRSLAEEVGWSYHQVWQLVTRLGLAPAEHVSGAALTLTEEAIRAVRTEHARLLQAREQAVVVSTAATMLDLPVAGVETLLRQGVLAQAPNPTGSRHRYIEMASVERYQHAYPAAPRAPGAGEVLLPFMVAARALGISRPALSGLTQTRQIHLARRSGSRHSYVTASSATAWAQRLGLSAQVTALAEAVKRETSAGDDVASRGDELSVAAAAPHAVLEAGVTSAA